MFFPPTLDQHLRVMTVGCRILETGYWILGTLDAGDTGCWRCRVLEILDVGDAECWRCVLLYPSVVPLVDTLCRYTHLYRYTTYTQYSF